MPSFTHEIILELFRNHPELAPLLLRQSLHVALPEYTSAQIVESTLIDIQPVEYRADLVVLLHHGIPVYGIVVEAQLQKESNKLYSWPAYAALLRSRERCPVCVLVFAGDETVADWARRPIDLGGGNNYTPWVISPLGVPIITNEQEAKADPELAVLSAMAHGADNDHNLAVSIALAAQCASVGLDADRSKMYCDLILNSLTETARQALMNMNPANYQYQSEFAKRYVAEGKVEGKVEGKAEGRCELLIKQLTLRFGVLPDVAHAQIQRASVAEIDAMGERVLSAQTLEEVMGSH